MTNAQILQKLAKCGVAVSSSTVRRSRKQQGWTLQQTAYCQLIRDTNKVKRLEYAQRIMESGDTFDVILSDECSISLVQYRCTCYRKVDEPTKRKPKPKHPLKVHVWAGISRHRATNTFDGIMDADLICNILETTLVPFIREKLPDHRFLQDNDPKHTSRRAKAFFEEKNINWWHTPPETPDLNPIEDLWHELKFFLESKVKPSKNWWMVSRSFGRRKSRQKSVQNTLITFCTRQFQLWWRLKAPQRNIKYNGSFSSHRALLRRIWILHCTVGR